MKKMLKGEKKGKAQLESLAAWRREAEVVRFGIFFQERRMTRDRDGWMWR